APWQLTGGHEPSRMIATETGCATAHALVRDRLTAIGAVGSDDVRRTTKTRGPRDSSWKTATGYMASASGCGRSPGKCRPLRPAEQATSAQGRLQSLGGGDSARAYRMWRSPMPKLPSRHFR